ncbi:MarR family winged helix-turn-helix transcriptional regulator [Alkalihalobacterium chitinilyticum]|uniref:MarR family transcriptional regulator n=1 Tax=Alkalihalobacterium chitinilyticum TaxID=2980103 RepID=A0ABT5VDI9_9BACI|nr:MarR family transcriptional regulator [Alkalihalobacterium chitinilyticum]MDE5413508.1 MarR family transcriptional regulator [Alkalihalobacterium chitinilyticum]
MERNIDERVGYHIGVVGHLLQNLYNEKLSEYGLTVAQAKVIYLLHAHGNLLQSELQKNLLIKAPTMNGIIESMLKKELIEKKDNESDRRSKTIILTEKGRVLEETLWNDIGRLEEELVNGLSKEEQKILIIWLKKLALNLQK